MGCMICPFPVACRLSAVEIFPHQSDIYSPVPVEGGSQPGVYEDECLEVAERCFSNRCLAAGY